MSLLQRLLLCAAPALATLSTCTNCTWPPQLDNVAELGELQTAGINRDSCGSVRMFDRVLWVCRDSQPLNASGYPGDPVVASSASWMSLTSKNKAPGLDLYGGDGIGTAYYRLTKDECYNATKGRLDGTCKDNTRFAIWPDSPPVVTSNQNGVLTAYTWVRQSHIKMDLASVVNDPKTSLYKVVYDNATKDIDTLPVTSLVDEGFWAPGIPAFGSYGNLVRNGTLYLYGQPSNRHVFLAKVPVGDIEDQTKYQYFNHSSQAWTAASQQQRRPLTMNDTEAAIPNAGGGGQGTFFYSEYWGKFVWIGQGGFSVNPDFMITWAPEPEGPWEPAVTFFHAKGGNFRFPGYSLQAHPSLSLEGDSMDSPEIWISYTKVNNGPQNLYYHPLLKATWK